jgi:hypothetical protein
MLKKIFVVTAFIIELLAVSEWFVCKQFKDFIHFSSFNQALYLKGLMDNDSGIPFLIVRVFHNKPIVFLDIFVKYYLSFWDDRFLLNLFSVVGCFGIILGIWYLLSRNCKHKKQLWIMLIFLLAFPLVEILFKPNINFIFKVIILVLPYQLFSLFGLWQFIKTDKGNFRMALIYCLLFLSIWWINVLQSDVSNYCVR